MPRVLLVGIDPDLTNFDDPSLPAGLDAEKIRLGIATSLNSLRADGHQSDHIYISDDPSTASAQVLERLSQERIDCVVIGGGVRLPPSNLRLFEAVLNAVGRAPQRPAIALTSRPDDAPAAVRRVLA